MTYFPRFYLVLAVCVLGLPAFGQQAPERTTFVGLVGGAGMTYTPSSPGYLDLDGAYLEDTHRAGHVLLLGTFVRMQRREWIAQPELRYQNVYSAPFASSRGGGGGYGSLFHGGRPVRERFHMRQLTASLLGGRHFGSQQQWYGLLGPALAWRLGTDWEPAPHSSYGKNESLPYAVDQAPTAMQVQLHGAVGQWRRHWGVEVRFVYGLTPLVRHITVQEQTYNFRVRSTMLSLSVGYRFGKAD